MNPSTSATGILGGAARFDDKPVRIGIASGSSTAPAVNHFKGQAAWAPGRTKDVIEANPAAGQDRKADKRTRSRRSYPVPGRAQAHQREPISKQQDGLSCYVVLLALGCRKPSELLEFRRLSSNQVIWPSAERWDAVHILNWPKRGCCPAKVLIFIDSHAAHTYTRFCSRKNRISCFQ